MEHKLKVGNGKNFCNHKFLRNLIANPKIKRGTKIYWTNKVAKNWEKIIVMVCESKDIMIICPTSELWMNK